MQALQALRAIEAPHKEHGAELGLDQANLGALDADRPGHVQVGELDALTVYPPAGLAELADPDAASFVSHHSLRPRAANRPGAGEEASLILWQRHRVEDVVSGLVNAQEVMPDGRQVLVGRQVCSGQGGRAREQQGADAVAAAHKEEGGFGRVSHAGLVPHHGPAPHVRARIEQHAQLLVLVRCLDPGALERERQVDRVDREAIGGLQPVLGVAELGAEAAQHGQVESHLANQVDAVGSIHVHEEPVRDGAGVSGGGGGSHVDRSQWRPVAPEGNAGVRPRWRAGRPGPISGRSNSITSTP